MNNSRQVQQSPFAHSQTYAWPLCAIARSTAHSEEFASTYNRNCLVHVSAYTCGKDNSDFLRTCMILVVRCPLIVGHISHRVRHRSASIRRRGIPANRSTRNTRRVGNRLASRCSSRRILDYPREASRCWDHRRTQSRQSLVHSTPMLDAESRVAYDAIF